MKSLPEIGDVVDDTYELVSVLGTGGFGAVYRARQLNIDRDVALKILVASGPKFGEMVKRFRREVMAIRNLTHPNTVRIYDFRDDPEGLLYYTMEALEGKTLKQEVKESGPLSPRRLKHVWRQVLKSLSEAHSYNIVHRDLKPANIMIVEMHGETDFVKVLDFGIAKLLQDAEEEEEELEQLTSAGILVGTLRYMAPEQIAGDALGPYTDLYAMGLIAVEMLTGESVFTGTGRWEVLQQQISDDPVAIPEPVLNSRLGSIIEGCLQKDRAYRFTSADEVLAALAAIEDSTLRDESLYISDGSDGWVPRAQAGAVAAATAADATIELEAIEELETVMVEDSLDEAKTMVSPRPSSPGRRGFGAGTETEDKTTLSEGPAPGSRLKATVPYDTMQSADQQTRQQAFKESNTAEVEREETVENASRQRMDQQADRLVDPTSSSEISSDNTKNIIIVALVLLLLGGTGFFVMMDDDDPEQDELAEEEMAQQGGAEDPTAAPEVDDAAVNEPESDDEFEFVEAQSIQIDVVNEGVRATVFVDDEPFGRTPYQIEIEDDEELLLRLEARGYEDQEIVLSAESGEEIELELIEVEDDDSSESVADRRGSSGSAVSGAGSPSSDQGARAPTPPPTVEAPVEEEDDDDGSWVDITRRDEPEEVEEEPAASGSDDWVDLQRPEDKDEDDEDDGNDVPLF